MLNRLSAAAIALALGAACTGVEFQGDDQKLSFKSDLSRPYAGWRPALPVAIGSTVHISLVPTQYADGGMSFASPHVPPGGALDVVEEGVNALTVRAAQEGGAPASLLGFGVLFDVPDGGVGDFGEVAIQLDGGTLGVVHVYGEDVSAAAGLELAAARLGQNGFLLVASPHLDGGLPLYQAPVTWDLGPGVTPVGDPPIQFDPPRRDVLVVSWNDADGGLPPGKYDAGVTAHVGNLTTTLQLPVEIPEPPANDPIDDSPDAGVSAPVAGPRGLVCCSSSGAGFIVLAGGSPLLRLLRRRRRKKR